MNTVRLPIRWEYLQPTLSTYDSNYDKTINNLLSTLTAANVNVILEIHNYMRYQNNVVGNSNVSATDLANVWGYLAKEYVNNPKVIFGIMNEPNSMDTKVALTDTTTAMAAIRQAEKNANIAQPHLILLEGNYWTGLHSWTSDNGSGANSDIFIPTNIKDANYAIDVHQYFDANFSGTNANCVSLDSKLSQINLSAFMQWVQTNNVKVFLSEFGTGDSSICQTDLDQMLGFIQAHPYVNGQGGFIGWTIWSAGHAWPSDYFMNMNPNANGSDKPQMTVVSKYLKGLIEE